MTEETDLGGDGDTDKAETGLDVQIPADEPVVVVMMGEDASEQEKNLAIAQAELIGDIQPPEQAPG